MSDKRPAISVLMPVYNAERYISQAVESILTQSFRDFELLIVNDGSTDDSLRILRDYEARDPRIRLISRHNTGLVAALNEMIALAQGDFLARMDADDIALPERFALQIQFLNSHPGVVRVGGAWTIIDAQGTELLDDSNPTDDESIQQKALVGQTPITHPTALMRKESVVLLGGYRADAYLAEDLDLWLRLGEIGQLANLGQVVLNYREHGNSISDRFHKKQLAVARCVADEARDRRGIAERCPELREFRPDDSRSSRYQFELIRGWWGLSRGNRRTALHYGLKTIQVMPWSLEGWKLLMCIFLNRQTSKAD